MVQVVISIDFLRYDIGQKGFDWLRDNSREYVNHYTHHTFTIPCLRRFFKKGVADGRTSLFIATWRPVIRLARQFFTSAIKINNEDGAFTYLEYELKRGKYDFIWYHVWAPAHAVRFRTTIGRKELLEDELLKVVSRVEELIKAYPEHEFVVTGDHGVITDPVVDGVPEANFGGRELCEVTLHVPLFIYPGEGTVKRRTHHDALADYLNNGELLNKVDWKKLIVYWREEEREWTPNS